MKPSRQAIEARIKIVNYLGDQMSRPLLRFQEDEIELIIQAAMSKGQDWRAVAQKQIEAHKIKAEDTPA